MEDCGGEMWKRWNGNEMRYMVEWVILVSQLMDNDYVIKEQCGGEIVGNATQMWEM